MRISDWSSDVCSSDLKRFDKGFVFARGNEAEIHARELVSARSCTRIGCLERSLAQNPQILRKTAEAQVAMFCAAHQQMQNMFPRTTDRHVHLHGFASNPGSRPGPQGGTAAGRRRVG